MIFFSFVRLSSFFSVEFVDVFVNMAYRYSSGLTRFKSDIYFISIVRTHLSVCLFDVRSLAHSDSFSFRYHAHKNMRLCVGFFFFWLFVFILFQSLLFDVRPFFLSTLDF